MRRSFSRMEEQGSVTKYKILHLVTVRQPVRPASAITRLRAKFGKLLCALNRPVGYTMLRRDRFSG